MTSEELFKKYSDLCQFEEYSKRLVDKDNFQQAMIEFAIFHTKSALEAATEEAILGKVGAFGTYWNRGDLVLDKQLILNAYPEDLIK